MTQSADRSQRNYGTLAGHGWSVRLGLLLAVAVAVAARAMAADEDPCAGFSWNVAHEHALFAAAPQAIAAGREPKSTPLLAPERLYQLQLAPQAEVSMALAPGRKPHGDNTYAGIVHLQLQQAGAYRIALDQPAWVDAVADGRMIESAGFQGRPGCAAPHKIVQFLLPGGRELLLQLSDAANPQLRITVTPVTTIPAAN